MPWPSSSNPDHKPTDEEWAAFLADAEADGQRLKASVRRMYDRLTPSERRVVDMRRELVPKETP